MPRIVHHAAVVREYSERLKQLPQDYHALFKGVWDAKLGKPARIKAKCLDCCNYQRHEVRDCTATLCPLWAVRPYQLKPTKKGIEND